MLSTLESARLVTPGGPVQAPWRGLAASLTDT